jgi:hypothetical protein
MARQEGEIQHAAEERPANFNYKCGILSADE